ncbi:hypothetical protein [Clostridium folliculivorans]|uniref:Uncharacterized protein n=1 Tax=Clostridium folliculivorans TaxID=2886038 RepID=A0A9W5Y1D6_9CLOT|nr:hypothetical protein [Clostridium folliculivorans]GKU24838.1 hypothetical protein CFOLD11_16640 [Clostridium folliculivorans]GKU30936.1 hypothetical protein CFB3_30430 [Clostridium folliculivorans]
MIREIVGVSTLISMLGNEKKPRKTFHSRTISFLGTATGVGVATYMLVRKRI